MVLSLCCKNQETKTTTKLKEIAAKIEYYLTLPGTRYILAYDKNDDAMQIRVSDHTANAKNNIDRNVLSLITSRVGYNNYDNEYVIEDSVNEFGDSIEEMLFDKGVTSAILK